MKPAPHQPDFLFFQIFYKFCSGWAVMFNPVYVEQKAIKSKNMPTVY